MEELWMPPSGSLMLGLHRDVFSSELAFFEYLRIENSPRGIYYIASPAGRQEGFFLLVESGGKRAVFENLQNDFPQRIIYWQLGATTLRARIEGEQDGYRSKEWVWYRASLPTE